jgi:hypothetical protein
VLSICDRLIDAVHLCEDFFIEILRGEEVFKVRLLHVDLISRVSIVEFLSASRSPSLQGDKVVIEDPLGIDLDKTSITIVGNSTTIVSFCNQILDGLPRNGSFLVILFRGNTVLQATHVNSEQVLTDRVVGIVKVIGDVPT